VADKIKKTTRKETADWHFVDIPLDEDSYDAARDCDEDNCVVPRIEEFRDVLADDGASKTKKKEALLFLVHFVGDIHQPMHATDNDDRGGGGVEFKFGEKKTNLHSIWDSGIISNTAGSESELVKRIKQRIANGEDDATGTAEEWANESHELGKDAYAQVLKSLGGDMKISNKELEEDGHIVEDQLLRASVRLAKALNDALD
jgi:hypothetical protein